MRKIEPVVLDYEGEPVTIEDGEIFWWFADEGEHWNSETRQFEPDEDDDDMSWACGCCGDDPHSDDWWHSYEHCVEVDG